MDISGTMLATCEDPLRIAEGPEIVLTHVTERVERLLTQSGRSRSALKAMGIGVPGPVEFATGRPIKPPIMPGWDGFPIAERLAAEFAGPVLVDNDVNIMALGEHSIRWPEERELMFIKAGTGVGCGIISSGHIMRGHEGAAGDIGHVHIAGYDDVLCHCGNPGCLEALAGGWAMAAELRRQGLEAETSADVVALALAGSPPAVQLVRRAGRLLGEVLSAAVNILNPGVIVLGGDLAQTEHHLMAGLREGVYQRSTPLATRDLRIHPSDLGMDAGVLGAAAMVLDHVLSPAAIDAAIAGAPAPAAPIA
jgi:predicted NBD/HSP70 family sugar kinase